MGLGAKKTGSERKPERCPVRCCQRVRKMRHFVQSLGLLGDSQQRRPAGSQSSAGREIPPRIPSGEECGVHVRAQPGQSFSQGHRNLIPLRDFASLRHLNLGTHGNSPPPKVSAFETSEKRAFGKTWRGSL